MSLMGLILAAGKGKRMKTDLPKVLNPVCGTPMLEWVIKALQKVPCDSFCAILGHERAAFSSVLEAYPDLLVCVQSEINGTGGAVAAAACLFRGIEPIEFSPGTLLRGQIRDPDSILICAGDTPALDATILADFVGVCREKKSKLSVLGMEVPNPKGYGRLVLSEAGYLSKIVEEKDADEDTRRLTLCNSGVLFADVSYLYNLLRKVDKHNSQGEYYLTDCIRLAVQEGGRPDVYSTDQWQTLVGANDQEQLASLESWLKNKKSV